LIVNKIFKGASVRRYAIFTKTFKYTFCVFLASALTSFSANTAEVDKTDQKLPVDVKAMLFSEDALTNYQRGLAHMRKHENDAAIGCFIKAAEQGYTLAKCKHAFILLNGPRVKSEEEIKRGIELLQEGAQEGCMEASFVLGVMYVQGRIEGSQDENDQKAVELFKKAASTGNIVPLVNLGILHMEGRVKGPQDKNDQKAAQYLIVAARKGIVNAQCKLGMMYQDNRVPPMNSKDYDEPWDSDECAVYWLDKAVKQQDPEAHYYLGLLDMVGRGGWGPCEVSFKKAYSLFEFAAKNGISEAWHKMGVMLMQGRGHPRNPYNDKLAVHYLTIAVEEGIKDAAAALAFMNFKGRGIKENHLDALYLYMLSSLDSELYIHAFLHVQPRPFRAFDSSQDFLSPLIKQLASLTMKEEETEGLLSSKNSLLETLFSFKEASPGLMLANVRPSQKVKDAIPLQEDEPFLSLDEVNGVSYLTIGQDNVRIVRGLIAFMDELKNSQPLTREASDLQDELQNVIFRGAVRRENAFLEKYPLKSPAIKQQQKSNHFCLGRRTSSDDDLF
jgi:TPR repeat protein